VSSLLLELDADGRFSHLELSTASGLLTLHPEPDGTLHGNAITSAGVAHVRAVPWDRDAVIRLEGSEVCRAVATSPAGGDGSEAALWISLDLTLQHRREPVDRPASTGNPLPDLVDGTTWPLEDEEPGSGLP
jgi:hypothetical protein